MSKIKIFVQKTFIGGLLVILPIVIVGFFLRWAFNFVTSLIKPLTSWAISTYQLPQIVADITVIALIFLLCFVVGTVVSTSIGRWLHTLFDKYLIKLAPGYRLIKEIVVQVFGSSENSPFSKAEVVRVKLFGLEIETTVTALVTDRHKDGSYTIFMPTGPNPTSGNIYHVPEYLVEHIKDASVEQMMKSIIACGAGSEKLFEPSRQE